jgi:lipopolysaccharide transport system ATP-binding protein
MSPTLLIDEVFAVGDTAFKHKCLERIARFKAEGCSILLVSHVGSTARRLDWSLNMVASR